MSSSTDSADTGIDDNDVNVDGGQADVPGTSIVPYAGSGKPPNGLAVSTRLYSPYRRPAETGPLGWIEARTPRSIVLPATTGERLNLDREATRILREQFRQMWRATLLLGVGSQKGGVGKTMFATILGILAKELNPGENVLVFDVNRAGFTLPARNGATYDDIKANRNWTAFDLCHATRAIPGSEETEAYKPFELITEFAELDAGMFRREDPQVHILPLAIDKRGAKLFNGTMFLELIQFLRRFYTTIIFDFGTEMDNDLLEDVLGVLHGFVLVTERDEGTALQTPETAKDLGESYPGLLENTVGVLNFNANARGGMSRATLIEKMADALEVEVEDFDPDDLRVFHFVRELKKGLTIVRKSLGQRGEADAWGIWAQLLRSIVEGKLADIDAGQATTEPPADPQEPLAETGA